MIWIIIVAMLASYIVGYVTCAVIANLTSDRDARNVNDVDHVPDAFDHPLWVDTHHRDSRAELVQRAMDLEKARHEVD